jgi:hypothetical protein
MQVVFAQQASVSRRSVADERTSQHTTSTAINFVLDAAGGRYHAESDDGESRTLQAVVGHMAARVSRAITGSLLCH